MNTRYRTQTGFTLVEMLIVIMMIAILAGLALRGLQSAQDYSARMRTKSTISKINRFVMTKYASYQYRYIPNVQGSTAQERALSRLQLLRQLQKEEMPDIASNFLNGTTAAARRFNQLTNNGTRLGNNTSAELLYLIVMGEDGADTSFASAEIGDTDGNGLMEFLDGWGRPIWYIRWPAKHSSCNKGTLGVLSNLQTGNAANQHDPFDPMRVTGAYAVFPLIFSSGPDGNKGIIMTSNETDPCGGNAGAPGEGDINGGDSAKKTKLYFDNITNHYLD